MMKLKAHLEAPQPIVVRPAQDVGENLLLQDTPQLKFLLLHLELGGSKETHEEPGCLVLQGVDIPRQGEGGDQP